MQYTAYMKNWFCEWNRKSKKIKMARARRWNRAGI